jgi:aminobenzoyl-glutamate utilization protein B
MEMADDVIDTYGENYCSTGSTDIGDVSWVVPAVEYITTTFPLGSPAHSWQWVAYGTMGLGHKSLIFSCKIARCLVPK